MNNLSKSYSEDEDGFNGNIEGYSVSTDKENLRNWLESEIADDGTLYDIIKNLTNNILIIQNINVDEEFQGQGFGSEILCNAINDSYSSAAILLCDIGESQREGFILENFYKGNGFETVTFNHGYPLMVFPEELALKIKNEIETQYKQVKKNKL